MNKNIGRNYVLKVSYLEIYNETLHDLLTIDDKPLELREDPWCNNLRTNFQYI